MKSAAYEKSPLCMPFQCFSCVPGTPDFPAEVQQHYYAVILRPRQGALRILRGQAEYLLQEGDFLFVSPGVPYHALPEGDTGAVLDVICLDPDQMDTNTVYAPDLKTILLEAERKNRKMFYPRQEADKLGLNQVVDQCLSECERKAYGYDIAVFAGLCLICITLIRGWIRAGLYLEPGEEKEMDLHSITGYINRHIQSPLRVEDLAEKCGLSYPWFAKKFREIYGIGCKEYIEQVRVSRVEQFLLFTDYDLARISRETGYADCSHMIKDFKRLRNTTPGRFRAARHA